MKRVTKRKAVKDAEQFIDAQTSIPAREFRAKYGWPTVTVFRIVNGLLDEIARLRGEKS